MVSGFNEGAAEQFMLPLRVYLRHVQNDQTNYQMHFAADCPQQEPGTNDCGPFVLHFVRCLALGTPPIGMTAAEGLIYRQQIMAEITDHLQQQQ